MWNVNHNTGNASLIAHFKQSGSDTPTQHKGSPGGDSKGKIVPLQKTNTSGLQWKRNDFQEVEIRAVENHIEVWVDDKKEIDYVDNDNPILEGGYGPYAASQSHATHRNLSVVKKETKAFSEVIRQPEWREDSTRLIVNMEDKIVPDFDDSEALGEILTRLINEDISYVAVGSDENKNQAGRMISRNNGNGTFIDGSSEYDNIINKISDHVMKKIEIEQEKTSEYVLVDKELDLEVFPEHLRENTENQPYSDGRWMIEHDHSYFDNNNGEHEMSEVYQPDFNFTFDKVGRYDIWFENRHPEPRFIYVHREPVASYSMQVKDTGSNYNVNITDMSYDPDGESKSNKGIANHEWKWKKTTATGWNDGMIPSSLPPGEDYIVQLRVKDEQGTWSKYETRYITTSDVVAQPIANFDMPSSSLIYDTITVNDTSYDPAGRDLSNKEWTVTKNGSEVYKGSEPITDFSEYGKGTYTVSLRVMNDAGIWSEQFNRVIDISVDEINPDINVDKENEDWTTNDVEINATFEDRGGSGFKDQRYTVTKSNKMPSSKWGSWSSDKNLDITLSDNGENYVHFQVRDNEGNIESKSSGPYKIDRVNPTGDIVASTTSTTHEDVTLTAIGSDIHSGVDRIKLPDNSWVDVSEIDFKVSENGSYQFVFEDKAGNNISKTIDVGNIDKTISFEKPSIDDFKNAKIRDSTKTISTDISNMKIADWRDTKNKWSLNVSATNLNNDGHKLPNGTLSLNKISNIKEVEGNNKIPENLMSSKINIDDGVVKIVDSSESRGEYSIGFPTEALEIKIDPSVIKSGNYKSTVTWDLIQAP